MLKGQAVTLTFKSDPKIVRDTLSQYDDHLCKKFVKSNFKYSQDSIQRHSWFQTNMSAYRIFQYIEFHTSQCNDILIHCCLYYMYVYI